MCAKKAGVLVVDEWLVLGSFPHPDPCGTLAWPYLPEESLSPSPGEKVAGRKWTPVEAPDGLVSLPGELPFTARRHCAAYAFTYVRSPKACKAKFLLGSGGGLMVVLNGRRVLVRKERRAFKRGQDSVVLDLGKGPNRLLLKTSPFDGEWRLWAAFAPPGRGKLPKLGFSLKNPSPKKWKGLRGYRGQLVPAEAQLLSKLEDGRAVLEMLVYNSALKKASATGLRLQSARGDELSAAELGEVAPLDFARARFRLSPDALTHALTLGDLALRVGDALHPVRSAELRAPALAQRILASGTGEQRRLAQGALGALEVVKPENTVAEAEVIEGLEAIDVSGAADALKRAIHKWAEKLPDRSSQVAHLVGHAHIDMNWLWQYPETVKTCRDTFRQALDFMREFPDFAFTQSQASCYRAFERTEPELFEEIKMRVAEGRWEIAGGMVDESDTNLSGGEALARSLLLGQSYFKSRFGKTAVVGWLPDDFGHVSQLPQLLNLAGLRYYYFCRCAPHRGLFWWEAPDGSRVLAYSNFTYNGSIGPQTEKDFEAFAPETRKILHVYGVGDHGGGPTRRHIEEAIRLDSVPRYPTLKFSTAEGFFADVEKDDRVGGVPVHRGEMQYVFEGCYTTISRVKAANRRLECALYAAEVLASLSYLENGDYPQEALRRGWEVLTFNQFHDILCGSAIHEANDDAVADYKWALSRVESEASRAVERLAEEVELKSGAGRPFIVFNPHTVERTDLVEAELFTHEPPATCGLAAWGSTYLVDKVTVAPESPTGLASLSLKDHEGRTIPAQVVGGKNFPPGWRARVLFKADGLPPCGYRAYYADLADPGEAEAIQQKGGRFETEHFTIEVDMKTGEVKRILDKRHRQEVLRRGGVANRLRVYMEAPHGMSAWNIGPITKREDIKAAESVETIERGPVRSCVEAVKRWGKSRFFQRTYIYKDYPRIDFELEAHWFEQGSETEDAPMLRTVFQTALSNGRFSCHVPFDAVERPATGQEVPAQRWVDVSDGSHGVALLNSSKYGHSCEKGELGLTLLRSSYEPDRYPEQGVHVIRYALVPHEGGWAKGGVWQEAEAFNIPPIATEPPSGSAGGTGKRPAEGSFMSLAPAGVVLAGVKRAEDGGGLVVRLVEVEGKPQEAVFRLPKAPRAARTLDILERPTGAAAPDVEGDRLRVTIRPYQIMTVGVEF